MSLKGNSSIHILIVDDCEIMREGLRAIIGRQAGMALAGEAGGHKELERFLSLRPDIILLGQVRPNGAETVAAIREEFPRSGLIVFTASQAGEDVRRPLQAGAQSLLPRNVCAAQLLEAIRAVHRGQSYIHAAIANRLAESITGPKLSRRELDVLELIARGVSNKRIGVRLGVTEGTVKSHVNNILGKLSASDRTDAVTRALKLGLLTLD
jgi:DNA-binding NarL/FixJ family response regulator